MVQAEQKGIVVVKAKVHLQNVKKLSTTIVPKCADIEKLNTM